MGKDGVVANFGQRFVSRIKILTCFSLTDLTAPSYSLPPLIKPRSLADKSSGSRPIYAPLSVVIDTLWVLATIVTGSPVSSDAIIFVGAV